MKDGKTYVLMVTARKTIAPMHAPATPQGAIDAMCSFEVFPAAVSDDVEALREHASVLRDRFSTIEGWNTFEVLMIGGQKMPTDTERREVAARLREKKAECEERGYPWMCDDLILALGYDHDYEAGDEIFDLLADLIDPDGADPGPRDLARAWGWK